ncbi:2-succinyl-6-hydroxy-2,4-cyclohexadiene-1-carboxylate synthase [Halobacillus litoralis]|uniref:Putative 2-succinyl-6-hydroxy-2,4-cyclohexadiene-1-carboxylate synthase n=1 Tax=Halobacillus litoralis TaxID=45668 RepID=A0A410MGU6_9BACI|nr:2-succinyl-6-hydroxy-2,4-cyclohexadiene-1-carboxylate synthase [Halobacillus litoralis]QAS53876.1 2-succinyl-6-hydroxy-2,4-cyclohexadiene-1-carboxylate synthase [Halobacillus litoralis]
MIKRVQQRNYWVEDTGEGPALLMLHGFTGSAATFNLFLENMNHDYRVLKVELPGHSRTGSVGVVTMEQFCCDLAAILDQMNLDKVTLMGYSLGGRTALSFAILYPHLVERLILESASPGLATIEERQVRQANDQKLVEQLQKDGIEKFVSFWENIPLFESQVLLPEQEKETLKRERLNQDPVGLSESLRGMGTGVQTSWWNHLSSLEIEVMLITGAKDSKFQSINRRMEVLLSYGSWIEVEGAGHTVHLEKPQIFAKIVDSFMIK